MTTHKLTIEPWNISALKHVRYSGQISLYHHYDNSRKTKPISLLQKHRTYSYSSEQVKRWQRSLDTNVKLYPLPQTTTVYVDYSASNVHNGPVEHMTLHIYSNGSPLLFFMCLDLEGASCISTSTRRHYGYSCTYSSLLDWSNIRTFNNLPRVSGGYFTNTLRGTLWSLR
jgi:hypothetical protein